MAQKENQNTEKQRRIKITVSDSEGGQILFQKITTRQNIRILVIVSIILTIGITYALLAFTPVRYAIPGTVASEQSKRVALANQQKIDSLEKEIAIWAFQIGNIRRIISGEDPLEMERIAKTADTAGTSIYKAIYAGQDSILRSEIEKAEAFSITESNRKITQIEGMMFFTPIKGIITENFNKSTNHPYIDIATETGTTVYSVLDGTVITAEWNDDTGYTLQIQHDNNIISIYKHNEKLLKKTGDKVTAGTPVAMAGNTGRLSTGTHLHFELWHNGEAVDPTLYIKF
ncbi:MAG: M23 family metallopeptidase [Bacteroidales bacterium]|nr:M23 family metallopeptidase [Bacteroidales bacterium]